MTLLMACAVLHASLSPLNMLHFALAGFKATYAGHMLLVYIEDLEPQDSSDFLYSGRNIYVIAHIPRKYV